MPKLRTHRRSIQYVDSKLTYEFVTDEAWPGVLTPRILGEGKFAKVFEAVQKCPGGQLKNVAIKALHSRVNNTAEELLDGEIKALSRLSGDNGGCFVEMLDVLELGPLFMSSCGRLFRPRCPQGCEAELARSPDSTSVNFRRLACPSCGWGVNGDAIDNEQRPLFQHPSNPFAEPNVDMPAGTIINFVDRRVIVMERLGTSLDDYFKSRDGSLVDVPTPRMTWSGPIVDLDARVVVLRKLDLMIQLAEAVYRLHHDYNLIHRDLAPDNVMVQNLEAQRSSEDGNIRSFGRKTYVLGASGKLLNTCSPLRLKIIDLGLSEEGEAKENRPWYSRGDVNNRANKWPYMSPEARRREEDIKGFGLDPENADRILLAPEMSGGDIAPKRGDMIVEKTNHDSLELKILATSARPRGPIGVTLDRLPERGRDLVLFRRLGKTHDLYSLGALLYYLLTEDHRAADRLRGFVESLDESDDSLDLTVTESVSRYPNYEKVRRRIPTGARWGDRIMSLILRAMVRGRGGSFVASRIEDGSEGVERFREEITRVHLEMQEEIIGGKIRQEENERTREQRQHAEITIETHRANEARWRQVAMVFAVFGFISVVTLFVLYARVHVGSTSVG